MKLLYKDLITVAKDQETGDIKSHSLVFQVSKLEGCGPLFTSKNPEHPMNALYVVVDPINWHVTLMHNKWEDYW